jgi:Macro domain
MSAPAMQGMRRIAFPAISCGIFRYPIPEAAAVAFEVHAALGHRTLSSRCMQQKLQCCQPQCYHYSVLRLDSSHHHTALSDCPLQTVKGHAGGLKEVAFLLHDQPAWDGFCRTAAAIAGADSSPTSHCQKTTRWYAGEGSLCMLNGRFTQPWKRSLWPLLFRTTTVQSTAATAAIWQ